MRARRVLSRVTLASAGVFFRGKESLRHVHHTVSSDEGKQRRK